MLLVHATVAERNYGNEWSTTIHDPLDIGFCSRLGCCR